MLLPPLEFLQCVARMAVTERLRRRHRSLTCRRRAQVWKAALLLCDWLLHNAERMRSTSVLELGAGVAMPSIVAATCGAACLATDSSEAALELARRNVHANQHAIGRGGGTITTLALDWSADEDALADAAPNGAVTPGGISCQQHRGQAQQAALVPKNCQVCSLIQQHVLSFRNVF